jgi:hypothetical protein
MERDHNCYRPLQEAATTWFLCYFSVRLRNTDMIQTANLVTALLGLEFTSGGFSVCAHWQTTRQWWTARLGAAPWIVCKRLLSSTVGQIPPDPTGICVADVHAIRQSDMSPPSRLPWCVLQVCPKFVHRLTSIAELTHHKSFTSSLLSHCFQSALSLRKSVHNSSSSSIENISSLVVVSWATKKDLHTKSIQLGCTTPTPHRPLSESTGDYMLLLLLSYLQLLLHTVWCDNSSLMESDWLRALYFYPWQCRPFQNFAMFGWPGNLLFFFGFFRRTHSVFVNKG